MEASASTDAPNSSPPASSSAPVDVTAPRPARAGAGQRKRELEEPVSVPVTAAPVKKAKAAKTAASASLLDKIIEAIRSEKKPGGSSRISIKKYLLASYQITNDKATKKAFQTGLDSGKLVQQKASFEVAGESYEAPPESRVDIQVMKEATGDITVGNNCHVAIDYRGFLKGTEMGGKPFETGSGFTFVTGQGDVIKGMDMGVAGDVIGETRRVTIPYQLGYGKRGSAPEIPPCSDLVFDITLRQIQQL